MEFDCPRQEKEYVRWTYDHAQGYVLVVAPGKRYRLHKAFCNHIFDVYAPGHVAKGKRWCFDTSDQAMKYARTESGQPPLTCGDDCRN